MATQALANAAHGPRGLGLMAQGKTAGEAIELLTGEDERRALCQVGIVDARGRGGLQGRGLPQLGL